MQVQNFEPTAGTLREFQDFCERLESALDEYSVAQDKTSKKPSGHEKGKKKRRQNTNDEDLKFCMMHGKNPTHTTKQCRTLKREVEKQKKSRENNGENKSSKLRYHPSQEEIHALAAFAKDAL